MTSTATPRLRSACHDQDRVFARAFAVLNDAIAAHTFPGVALAVTYRGTLVALKGAGRFTYDPASPAVSADTIYDLASVTKVVATTAAAMVLYERGNLKLEQSLVEVVPEFAAPSGRDVAGTRRQDVTIRMLLAHSSGLPGYARLFEHAQGREAMLRAACSLPLETVPGTRAEYSDIGFMLLGTALERLAGDRIDRFCQSEIFTPLGMRRTAFRGGDPANVLLQNEAALGESAAFIPPTENDGAWRKRIIQGEVQDENAAAMGGISAHAGLFAPAEDVAIFAECMLAGGSPILRRETVELFTRRETSPSGTSRALGWDTPSKPSQSGQYFSPRSFGHLGYAGTSLWIDPERRLSITLLTNRTWPDRKSQLIKRVRPRFHDAVVEALELH